MARIVSKEDSKLVLKADGSWYHEGHPATHAGIKRFFHRQIRTDERGEHYLYNAIEVPEKGLTLEEHVYFDVEDAAFFVNRLERSEDHFEIELNTGAAQRLDVGSLAQGEEGALYCRLDDGQRARFSRHALTQLEPFLEASGADGDERIFLRDGGRRVAIGRAASQSA